MYIGTRCKLLGVDEEDMTLVVSNTFKHHEGDELRSLSLENNILSVIALSNCTDIPQLLTFPLIKLLKDHGRRKEPEYVKVDTRLSGNCLSWLPRSINF